MTVYFILMDEEVKGPAGFFELKPIGLWQPTNLKPEAPLHRGSIILLSS